MHGISPCDALTIRAGPGLSGVHMVASWFAHTPPKMPVKTSSEFFVLLTTYVVVHGFRLFCELSQECPCHEDFPYSRWHNNMIRCKKKATSWHWIFECVSILLLVVGLIVLLYIGIMYDVLEHRTAFLLCLGLTTMITSILSLVCNRDAPD